MAEGEGRMMQLMKNRMLVSGDRPEGSYAANTLAMLLCAYESSTRAGS
jgi:hypothetical protein